MQHMRFVLDDFQLWEFVFMESTISAPQRNNEEDVGGLGAFLTVGNFYLACPQNCVISRNPIFLMRRFIGDLFVVG